MWGGEGREKSLLRERKDTSLGQRRREQIRGEAVKGRTKLEKTKRSKN